MATVRAMDFPAWDPVLLGIPGLPIDIRWYGMMYVVGFLCAQWIFVRLARAGFFPVPPERAPDLIFYCVFGVMLGGRVGYALFYDQSLLNPLEFVQVWKGGLAFHGGLGGVVVAVWLFCRRFQLGWARTADTAALGVCPGILAVRFANFINGELYGRETTPETFGAMQFPTDQVAMARMEIQGLPMRDRELCIQVAFGRKEFADIQDQLSQVDRYGRPIPWDRIEPRLDWDAVSGATRANQDGVMEHIVPFRHPSQLYEGLCEGLLVGIGLWIIYRLTRRRPMRPGRYAAIFLLGYAIARFSLEYVRKPDSQFFDGGNDGTVLWGMTMGQTLTLAMVIGALLILCWPSKASGAAPSGDGSPPASAA